MTGQAPVVAPRFAEWDVFVAPPAGRSIACAGVAGKLRLDRAHLPAELLELARQGTDLGLERANTRGEIADRSGAGGVYATPRGLLR